MKGYTPIVYTYGLEKGSLTMGGGDLWARREIWSASKAFHKDNETKMAKPDSLEDAAKKIEDHFAKYKPGKKGGLATRR